jgi:hypothetical protein
MTQDDIIRMAREAGMVFDGVNTRVPLWISKPEELECFATLVAAEYERQRKAAGRYEDGYRAGAAAEREECAKLADKYMERWTAEAIRARGSNG